MTTEASAAVCWRSRWGLVTRVSWPQDFVEASGLLSVSAPKQACKLGNLRGIAASAVLRDGKLDRAQQLVIANRFGQEHNRTALSLSKPT